MKLLMLTLLTITPYVRADGYHMEADGTMVGDQSGGVPRENRVETVPEKPIQREIQAGPKVNSDEHSQDSEMTYENMQHAIKSQEASDRRKKLDQFFKRHPGISKETRQTIQQRKISLGMTRDEVTASWGEPEDIHQDVGSWGIREQWIYGKQYVYFENGHLTGWQN